VTSSTAGSAGAAAACGCGPGCFRPLISVTFSTTTLGGRLFGRLISARPRVSGAVTLSAANGPVMETVPLAVASASSRAVTLKLARVADNSALGPPVPLNTRLPSAFSEPPAPSPADNDASRKRSPLPTRSALRSVSAAPLSKFS
jgi:hypothetical protein